MMNAAETKRGANRTAEGRARPSPGSIPLVGKPGRTLGETGGVSTLGLSVLAERFVTVSLEEDVLVTEDSCEFFSTPQRELICIE